MRNCAITPEKTQLRKPSFSKITVFNLPSDFGGKFASKAKVFSIGKPSILFLAFEFSINKLLLVKEFWGLKSMILYVAFGK